MSGTGGECGHFAALSQCAVCGAAGGGCAPHRRRCALSCLRVATEENGADDSRLWGTEPFDGFEAGVAEILLVYRTDAARGGGDDHLAGVEG